MNKDNVVKYVSEIQILLGKLLSEIGEGNVSTTPTTIIEYDESRERERNMIGDMLKNTNQDNVLQETEEEMIERITAECHL